MYTPMFIDYNVELHRDDFPSDSRIVEIMGEREYALIKYELCVIPGGRQTMYDPGYPPTLEVEEAMFEDDRFAQSLTEEEQLTLTETAFDTYVHDDDVWDSIEPR